MRPFLTAATVVSPAKTVDLYASPYGLLAEYDLPEPELKSDAAKHDRSGNAPLGFSGDRHAAVGFTLRVRVTDTSASAVESAIADLRAAFQPGARLTVTEGRASVSRYTFIETVTHVLIEEHRGTSANVRIRGTRCPYWHGAEASVQEATITNNHGTLSAPSIPGDVPALTRWFASGPSGTTGIVLAVRATNAGFTWSQDESGTAGAGYIGGGYRSTALSSSYVTVSSTRTLTTSAYLGRFLIAARVSTAANTKIRASVGGVYSPMSVCVGGGIETVLIGPVNVPATGFTRDFPPTDVFLQAKGTGNLFLDAWWLVPVPSPLTTDAAIIHLASTMCLDGIPLVAPNVYSWTRATDKIGPSTLDKATPWGWPMLRPGNNTLFVHFAAPTLGTGYVGAIYIPRYLLPA